MMAHGLLKASWPFHLFKCFMPGGRAGLVLSSLIFLLASAGAKGEVDKPLRFCFVEWRPFTYLEDGAPQGITVNVMREAARRAGYEVIFAQKPWRRCVLETHAGWFDAVMDSPAYESLVQGPTLASVYGYVVIARKDEAPAAYKGLSQLQGKTVGTVIGYEYPPAFVEDTEILKVSAPSDVLALRMLDYGRIDFMLGDFLNSPSLIRRHGLALELLEPVMDVTPLYPAFHASKKDVQAKFDEALASLHEDGFIDQFYQQVFGRSLKEFIRLSGLDGYQVDPTPYLETAE